MFGFKKRRMIRKNKIFNKTDSESLQYINRNEKNRNETQKPSKNIDNYSTFNIETWNSVFSTHISLYTGQTVTIFVKSGGLSGLGFTGILLNVCKDYITLIIGQGPAPSCSLANKFHAFSHFAPHIVKFNYYLPMSRVNRIGVKVYIPTNKIAAFVHNAI